MRVEVFNRSKVEDAKSTAAAAGKDAVKMLCFGGYAVRADSVFAGKLRPLLKKGVVKRCIVKGRLLAYCTEYEL